MFTQGQTFEREFSFTQQDVIAFSRISGDTNPIHLDEDYAAKTAFKKPIIHGFLGGSIISKILGTQFPGEGTIYLSQNMEFKRPMYVDESYKAILTIKELIPARHQARIETKILRSDNNKLVLTGEAFVMNRELL